MKTLAAALLAAFMTTPTVGDMPDDHSIKTWAAPPYWTLATRRPGFTGTPGREALSPARQSLAGGAVALPFTALPGCRLVDTRGNAPLTGGFLPPATVRSYTLTGVCNVPPTAQAISLNATVTDPTGPGFLVLWSKDDALPPVSTLNFVAGQTVANAAVVPLSADGSISMALGVSGADVILDTNGYYDATSITAGAVPNPLQIALLRWYPAIQNGTAYSAGSSPTAVAFDGAHVWIANHLSDDVTKLRAADGELLGTFRAGTGPSAVAFDGANIWVTNRGSNNVIKLRASDGVNLGTFSVGSTPSGVAFDGANIWVTNSGSNNVTKLRASDGMNLGAFAVGTDPSGVAFDGANVWVTNWVSNNVTKLRASDGTNLGTFSVGTSPGALAFDGANIWVTNSSSENVTKLRATDGLNLGTFSVGTAPSGIAFDGTNVWVACVFTNSVVKLRARDGAALGAFSVGMNPQGVAFDGANIWVATAFGGVTKL